MICYQWVAWRNAVLSYRLRGYGKDTVLSYRLRGYGKDTVLSYRLRGYGKDTVLSYRLRGYGKMPYPPTVLTVYLLLPIVVDLPFFAFASSLYLKLRFR